MNRVFRIFLFLLLFIELSTAQSSFVSKIGSYITPATRQWKVPGLALAIVRNDTVLFAGGFGTRTVSSDEPVDEHTMFAIASNTKAFTAAALGILVDEDKINWDDPVRNYLPQFQFYDPYVTHEITIRDLLCHRSGLPPYAADHLWQGSDYSRDEIMRRFRFQKPSFGFRAKYAYSNVQFLAAGEIIPAVTGQSWDEFISERFFKPLQMSRSNTDTHLLQKMTNVATPHVEWQDRLQTVEYYNLNNVAPAAAVNSCVADLARWIRMRLADGEFNGKQVLDKKVLTEMRTAQIALSVSEKTSKQQGRHFSAYGLGLALWDYAGRKIVSHSGLMDGMTSMITVVPEENIGFVILTNKSPHNLNRALTLYILDRFFGLPERDWSREFLEENEDSKRRAAKAWEKKLKARIPDTLHSLALEKYCGNYEDPLSGEARVYMENGKLVFYHNQKYIADLEHWHFDTFRANWRDPFIAGWAGKFIGFHLNTDGDVDHLEAVFDNPVTFKRKK